MSNCAEKRTPYYEINLNVVKENYNKFIKAVRLYDRNDIIAYSVKANYDKKIIYTLYQQGSYFEVCSEFEYKLLRKNGIPANKIIFNGISVLDNKMLKYICESALFIIDSKQQLDFLLKENANIEIGIRLNLDYIKQNDNNYRNKESRFGIDYSLDEIKEIVSKYQNIKIRCLQCHFSGNTRIPYIYKQITKELCTIIKKYCLQDVQFVDIGGGYKISDEYWKQDDYISAVSETLKEENMQNLQVIYEPGNSIVRTACSYYTKVIGIKENVGKRYVLVDGTKLHIVHTYKNMKWEIVTNVTKNNIVKKQYIIGSTCKESDVLLEVSDNEEFKVGDIVCFQNVGAYTLNSLSSFILELPQIYYSS